jgi:Fe-S-cluster containining protein
MSAGRWHPKLLSLELRGAAAGNAASAAFVLCQKNSAKQLLQEKPPGNNAMSATALSKAKLPREKIPAGKVLCEYCTAKCCRYFALPIETPTTLKDFEYIRWYLLHDRASVFTDEDDWYLLVHTECKHLQADYRCGIYETRPQICREYTTDACEYEDDWTYERYLETAEQVAEYAEAVLPRKDRSIRSSRPPLLPIV